MAERAGEPRVVAPDLVAVLESHPMIAGGGVDRQGFAVAVELLPARAGAVGQVGELRRADPPIADHPKAHDIAAVAEKGEAVARDVHRGETPEGRNGAGQRYHPQPFAPTVRTGRHR